MPKHNKLLGAQGEQQAAHFLEEVGYILIERNWRTRYGEIDIIASRKNILYFVEVKTRSSLQYGYPIEAINYKKLRRMQLTARLYASAHYYRGPIRLMVVAVLNNQCSLHEIEG